MLVLFVIGGRLFLSSFSLLEEIDKLFTLNEFFDLFLIFNKLFISVGVVVSA